PADNCYQASVDRWNNLNAAFEKNAWADAIFDLTRSAAPLTKTPWVVFRRMLAELRGSRGAIDPDKDQHIAIFLDLLASSFVLWAVFARDIRRFYEPTMDRAAF